MMRDLRNDQRSQPSQETSHPSPGSFSDASAARVSEKEVRVLREAAAHRDGVVGARYSGFERINSQRRLESLAKRGLLEPSPYGDFYITEAGRAVLPSTQGRGSW